MPNMYNRQPPRTFNSKLEAFSTERDLLNKRNLGSGKIYVESYLRSEVILGSDSRISFEIQENVSSGLAIRKTEKRLKQSDTFTVTGIGFFIGRCVNLSSGTNSGFVIPRCFPNPQIFTGTTTVTEANELQKIYNGFMTVQRDQTKYFEALPMMDHYCVTEAQQGVAISTVATTGLYQRDGHFNREQGFRKINPTFDIVGTKKCEISIQLPDTAVMTCQTAGSDNIGILILRGLVEQRR